MSTLHTDFTTYSECNKYLFDSIERPEDLVVDDVCLLKIIQIGVKIPYLWKSVIDIHPFLSVVKEGILPRRFEKLSNRLKKSRDLVQSKEVIALDHNRISDDGNSKNLGAYLAALGQNKVAHFVNALGQMPLADGAAPVPNSAEKISFRFSEAIYALKVYRCISKLCRKNRSLQPYRSSILRSAELYLKQWRTWKRVLEDSHVKTCLLVCHYHNEGFIHACRDYGVEVIEIQHGVIMESSIFYVYPKAWRQTLKKSLFPDKIHVFGKFWKEKLLKGSEFEPGNIHIVGDVMGEIPDKGRQKVPGQNSLLVSSQTGMHKEISTYLKWLIEDCEQKQQNYSIVIKPHPNEQGNEYEDLTVLSSKVQISKCNLSHLLAESEVHLTIFSMTIFATMFTGKTNYCIHHSRRADFQQEMIDAGVSRNIEVGMNIFEFEGTSPPEKSHPAFFIEKVLPNEELLALTVSK